MDVGFIGLGIMGASMASNLQTAGHALRVHDIRRQAAARHLAAGAAWKDTPRAVAEAADVVFLSLPGPAEVEAVALGADGLIHGMRKGSALLDAPVSGGPIGAKTGKLAIWVGGDRALFDRHKPLLDAMGDQAYYVGPIGAGAVAKLVHNCTSFAVRAVMAETFSMGVKAGVDPLALWKAVRQGATGRRRTFDGLMDKFLPGTYDPPSFALKLGHKDVSLATALGREVGVPMRLANMALEELTEALNRGWGDKDSSSYMLLETERAGIELSVPPEKLREVIEQDTRP